MVETIAGKTRRKEEKSQRVSKRRLENSNQVTLGDAFVYN
jgi:hypothetical protein